jgi:sulfite reductase (NADPH) flavoprotein alpha-component
VAFAADFLYGDELTGFVDSRTLTRLDLAFSRDGAAGDAKVYVQQRMRENAAELYGWPEDGAHPYVCGDEKRMARDVDAALHDIVARCGGMDADAAHAYVNDLVKSPATCATSTGDVGRRAPVRSASNL